MSIESLFKDEYKDNQLESLFKDEYTKSPCICSCDSCKQKSSTANSCSCQTTDYTKIHTIVNDLHQQICDANIKKKVKKNRYKNKINMMNKEIKNIKQELNKIKNDKKKYNIKLNLTKNSDEINCTLQLDDGSIKIEQT